MTPAFTLIRLNWATSVSAWRMFTGSNASSTIELASQIHAGTMVGPTTEHHPPTPAVFDRGLLSIRALVQLLVFVLVARRALPNTRESLSQCHLREQRCVPHSDARLSMRVSRDEFLRPTLRDHLERHLDSTDSIEDVRVHRHHRIGDSGVVRADDGCDEVCVRHRRGTCRSE